MFKALLQMLLRITKPKTGKPRFIYTQSKTRDGGKMSKQTHLADYLSYYQALEAPSYAVLVTGEWGTGKTYQVKHLIPEAERYYVSLFGVQTVEQIHAEVLAAASPKLAKAAALVDKASGTIAEIGGLFALAGATPSVFNAIFRRDIKPDRTLIFDDLERSNLGFKDVLGVINSYVEQHKFRVIVIAHDEKMAEEFREVKEKTFGQTIKISPQIDEAFDTFLSNINKERSKTIIELHRDTILTTFQFSEVKSLRILRHVVEDLSRLVSILLDEHINHEEAMAELVPLFVAFNIETRMGRLSEEALNKRQSARLGYLVRAQRDQNNLPDKPPLLIANERYTNVDLENQFLSDDLLCSIFIEGHYPVDEIRQSIDNSVYFIKPSDVAPWRIVINFDELGDEVVQEAVVKMDLQIKDRSVTESGEILHIFSLKLMMVENSIQSGNMEEVVEQAIAYINDLRTSGRLPPRTTDIRWIDCFERSYEGMGYWVTDKAKPYFNKIFQHLIRARNNAFEDKTSEIITSLLNMIKTNPKEFFELISSTSGGENTYASIPILHQMPVEDFVSTWLSLPNENWRKICFALANRYAHGRLKRDLAEEEDWAFEVYQALIYEAERAESFRSLRIRRVIPDALTELANERNAAQSS